jgi:hypothetical protein
VKINIQEKIISSIVTLGFLFRVVNRTSKYRNGRQAEMLSCNKYKCKRAVNITYFFIHGEKATSILYCQVQSNPIRVQLFVHHQYWC